MAAPTAENLHVVVVPLMAQGHMIPAVDMAVVLAERGVLVSVVTTPANAARLAAHVGHYRSSGLPLRLIELPFPCAEAGLPDGCESLDLVPSRRLFFNFFEATSLLRAPLESYLKAAEPRPSCIISDYFHPWTAGAARSAGVPRLVFQGPSCLVLLCYHMVEEHRLHDRVPDELTPFEVPGLPHRITATRAQAPGFINTPGWKLRDEALEADATADGVVLNSFEDLEPQYIEGYKKATGKKVWAIGPLCLGHKDLASKAGRGDAASIDEGQCLRWLDSMEPRSVVYVSFGSLTSTPTAQVVELGSGLEGSGKPFIWVIKRHEISAEVERWLSEFEERTKERGLVIKGWAPQAVILSHAAVGGFVTHCGWNSALEGICAGLPMVTWPHFADQFLNEKLVVEVLKTGVPIGVAAPLTYADEKNAVVVKREEVERAVRDLMGEGEEGRERRERAEELGVKARKAVEKGGSSYADLTRLIAYISQHADNA